MNLFDHMLAAKPEITRRDGETIYRWGTMLAVIVRDDREIGQFALAGKGERTEVEQSMLQYLGRQKG